VFHPQGIRKPIDYRDISLTALFCQRNLLSGGTHPIYLAC
jgi:hypothetical protein